MIASSTGNSFHIVANFSADIASASAIWRIEAMPVRGNRVSTPRPLASLKLSSNATRWRGGNSQISAHNLSSWLRWSILA